MRTLDLCLLKRASEYLKGKVLETPIEFSPALTKMVGDPCYLKLEAFQITGSFKVRGALFAVSLLTDKEKTRGVASCSAGNHGLGLAYAAKKASVECSIYVPKSVDLVKKEKISSLGAKVVVSQFNGYDETFEWAENEIKKSGQCFISAFDNGAIMAGNGGTVAAEIMEQVSDVENIVFPVGGGGLAAGIAYYIKESNPEIKLFGCQHINSPALKLSLEAGKAFTALPPVHTIAAGIEGGIGLGCFEILKSRIDGVALATEKEIEEALLWVLDRHQILIEPSAAVVVACCLSGKLPKLSGKTVLVLSGRNVSLQTIKSIVTKNDKRGVK